MDNPEILNDNAPIIICMKDLRMVIPKRLLAKHSEYFYSLFRSF